MCETCRARVQPLGTEALCSSCGDALDPESSRFAAALGVTECHVCRIAPPEFTRAVAYTAYDDTSRELLHLLKFQGMAAVATCLLAPGIAQAMQKLQPFAASDALVVPVPLFAARARSRGFNQAELLAEAGMAQLRKLSPEWRLTLRRDVLRRVRDTNSSFTMAPHERRANLRGAFRVTDSVALQGREILLVDDILTTGATARECARVLLKAGVAKVWVATYARTFSDEPGGRPMEVAMWSAPSGLPPPP